VAALPPGTSISLCVVAKGRHDPAPFLEALRAQGFRVEGNVDVHLAHDEPLPDPAALERAGWQLHRCPEGTSILRLWGAAIAASTQRFVATLDIECPPDAGWWNTLLSELDTGKRVFTGPVAPGWRSSEWMVVGYLVEYAQFHRPHHPGVHEVPGINFVCERALLDSNDVLRQRGLFKTFTLWRLAREQKIVATRCDEMQVVFRRRLEPKSFLRRRYLHGRCFGGCRHEQPGQPLRWACVLFAPALPVLRCARIWRAARRHADLHRAYWRQLHWVVLSELAWSWGEFVGYLLGAGDACDRLD
jgi:hypothetical protein